MSVEASTDNEKASSPPPNGRFSWLKPKNDSPPPSLEAEDRPPTQLGMPSTSDNDPKPISFTGLFRSVLILFLHPINIFFIFFHLALPLALSSS
jgi:hypothetical protein